MSEVYDAGVLADVQQAQRIVAAFLTAESFTGLLDNVSKIVVRLYNFLPADQDGKQPSAWQVMHPVLLSLPVC